METATNAPARGEVEVSPSSGGASSSPSSSPPSSSSLLLRSDGDATDLVDGLLLRTSGMMDPRNAANVVAFSGGVDSSLVAALVVRAFDDHRHRPRLPPRDGDDDDDDDRGARWGGSVRAVLGISAAVSQVQIDQARIVADFVGIPLTEVRTNEGDDDEYVRNDGRACYACKTHLYSALEAVAREAGAGMVAEAEAGLTRRRRRRRRRRRWREGGGSSQDDEGGADDDGEASGVDREDGEERDEVGGSPPPSSSSSSSPPASVLLYNGTNADDLLDPTRLGLIAASDFLVRSPLDLVAKGDVRRAARHLGLPNWDAAASPCLRSRLAIGVEATRDHLRAVEMAEAFVRDVLGLDGASNARVRMMAGGRAVVELDDSFFVVGGGGGGDGRGEAGDGDSGEGNGGGRAARALLIERGFEERCVQEWGFGGGLGGVRPFRTGSVAVSSVASPR